ncbi:MAG: hypothetical protein R6W89_10350 [Candidatus Hydrogenedentota bacterium]
MARYIGLSPAEGHAAHARWQPVADLAPLAFDHGGIMAYAVEQLKDWSRCKGVGMLEEPFPFGSLARSYTLIRGEPVSLDALGFLERFTG